MKNIQSYNQRLYTNESGIGESITKRLESLQNAAEVEGYYDTKPEYDLDEFEVAGFDGLFNNEDFEAEV